MEPVPMRADARRSREAILSAAAELFAEQREVTMHDIARRAGVGQATLYRQFAGVLEVLVALGHTHVDALEQTLDPAAGLHDLLDRVVAEMVRAQSIARVIRHDGGADVEVLKDRIRALVVRPLATSQATGEVDAALTVEDVMLSIMMVEGALEETPETELRAQVAERALRLLRTGITPR